MELLRKILTEDQRGGVLVVVAAGLLTFLGLIALVSDVGLLYLNRVQLVNGVDAAALAGAMELPHREAEALLEAHRYGAANGLNPETLAVTIAADKMSITVKERRTVDLFFARVFGFAEAPIGAEAVARVAPVTGVRGVVPLGVEWDDFIYGEQYTLKHGGGDGITGNYGALALGGTGASRYLVNLQEGYQGWLRVGDLVPTEPGNISGNTAVGVTSRLDGCLHSPACTHDNYQPDCPRVVIVPVIFGLREGRHPVDVVGFASFFLETVGGSGNESYVTGRFLQMVVEGESDQDQGDYGLRAGKLAE